MRLRVVCSGIALGCFLAARLFAQPAPPYQESVAAIGASPLTAPLTAGFSPGAAFTLEGWVYLTAPNRPGWLMGKLTSGADPFVSFSLQLSENQTPSFSYSTGVPGSLQIIAGQNPIPLRTWTHIAAVMDGNTTRLLVNGAVVANGTANGAPPAPTGVPFSIGIARTADGGINFQFFPGYARQLRLWNVARTPAQIAAALGESLPTERGGLVAAWPLDDAKGAASVRDLSGAGHNLAAGSLVAVSPALLAAGPFYADAASMITDGSLNNLNGGTLIDFDSDGALDFVGFQIGYTQQAATPTRLRAFRNVGGVFSDVTDAVLGTVTLVHPRHSVVGDFNGDGRADLMVVGHGYDYPPYPGEQSRLLIQTADGRLADETATRLPAHSSFTHNVAAADIDGDGDLDIFMCNPNGGDVGPRFYLNDGRGIFTEDTSRLPADITDRTNGMAFTAVLLADFNGDRRPDIVLGTADDSHSENQILFNDGRGRFLRDSRSILPVRKLGPHSTAVHIASADLDGDGLSDLILATTGNYLTAGIQFLLSRGDGTFRDVTATAGLTFGANEQWVAWAHPVDLNGDGRPDLVAQVAAAVSGTMPRLFLNTSTPSKVEFLEVTGAYGFPQSDIRFVQAGDLDRDGKTDLLVATPFELTLARNLKNLELGRLANLSVRSQIGPDNQNLIAGFALGNGAGAKSLLVRAIGPTLSAFNVTDALADPLLEVAPLGGANVAANSAWGGAAALKNAFTRVGAFPLSPDTSNDAALLVSPLPGAYTAKVTSAGNRTGLALVEIYDAGTENSPRLVNVSARSRVGTGGGVLITGFAVNGTLPKRLLIRAGGPSLEGFGVGGALADPMLIVRPLGSDSIVANNDDWAGTAALKAAFVDVGAFPFTSDASKDAALIVELPPGAYTATVVGKNNATGVALVEVYELP